MGISLFAEYENLEEAILKLSVSEKAQLAGWIMETMVEPPRGQFIESTPLGKIRPPVVTDSQERATNIDRLAGSWKGSESAEALTNEIYAERTINDREHLFDE